MINESKTRHLQFMCILHVPGIWAGMAISPEGVILELRKCFILIFRVKKKHELEYDHDCDK